MGQADIATMTENQENAFAKHSDDVNQLSDLDDRILSQAMTDAELDLSTTLENGISIQYVAGGFTFTGTLTASRKVLLNATNQKQFSVLNSTTGGFDITVGYAAGDQVTIPNGESRWLRADGTNVAELGGGGGASPLTTKGDVYTFSTVDARLAVGANDLVLTADSAEATGLKWAAGGGGSAVAVSDPNDWTLLDVQEASASASIDLTFDASLYDQISIEFQGVIPATNTTDLWMRVSDDGGATFEAGATDYEYGSVLLRSDAADTEVDSTGAAQILLRTIGNAAGESASGTIIIPNPGNTSNHTLAQFDLLHIDGTLSVRSTGIGTYTAATSAINGVQFLMSAGNITSGKFILRGRKTVTTVPDLNILAQSPDWEIIDVQEASASANIDLLFDPNLYDELELTGLDVIAATEAAVLRFLVSDDGGATFEGGTGYDSAGIQVGDDATTVTSLDQAGQAHWNTEQTFDTGAATSNAYFTIRMASPGSALDKHFFGMMTHTDGNDPLRVAYIGARFDGNTNAIDGLRVIMSSGNIASGKFILRGRRKITTAPITGGESVILSVQTASASAQIDFTFDPTLYDRLIVEINDLTPASDAVSLTMRVSEDGGSTFISTASYDRTIHGLNDASTTLDAGATGETSWLVINALGNLTNEFAHAEVILPSLDGTRHKLFRAWVTIAASDAASAIRQVGGRYDGSTNAIDGIRFLMSTGNIATGKFILRGIKKVV